MNCGAICLQHIQQQHGKRLSLRQARKLCKTTRNGTKIVDLMNALDALGYKNVRVKQNLTWGQLRNLVNRNNDVVISWMSDLPAGNRPMPADGHYSVAKKITKNHIVIYDPDVEQDIKLPKNFFMARFYDFDIDHSGKRTDFLQAAVIARYGGK